jgi:colanic acid/amylovoran biosynthesis glycosyltransferase
MRVLHCFSKYLNTTMNWAYKSLSRMPDGSVVVAAPTVVHNRFWVPQFEYIESPYQWQKPTDEWSVSLPQRAVARLTRDWYWRGAFRQARAAGVQVVHAHFAQVGCQVMRLAAQYDLPLVVSFYGLDYEMLPQQNPRYKVWYAELFERAALLLCEGAHGVATLTRMGCPPDKIRVARLGIEVSAIQWQHTEKKTDVLRLVQAATMIEKKGYLTTLEALALARQTCPGITLTVVGEQDDAALVRAMRTLIAEKGLQNAVKWLDFVPNEHFYAFLGGFDAFVHPSQYASNRDCEGGAPIVLLDAQAVGLPVLSTTHCDIPGEVLDGRTGWLVAERDAVALAERMVMVCKMQDIEFQRFRNAARAHVEAEFDLRVTIPTWWTYYMEVADLTSYNLL